MTIGILKESSFCGKPEGLSRISTSVAGPEYVPTDIAATNGTCAVVIQSD